MLFIVLQAVLVSLNHVILICFMHCDHISIASVLHLFDFKYHSNLNQKAINDCFYFVGKNATDEMFGFQERLVSSAGEQWLPRQRMCQIYKFWFEKVERQDIQLTDAGSIHNLIHHLRIIP